MAWTVEQQKAIDLDYKNILVSAGAGSGKTAVLTERVKRKLLSGVHIHQLLILTFTNAAAAEMKDRIRKRILNTPELKKEIDYIDSAFITTFDSFSLYVVKKYHMKLNITNHIQICDEVLLKQKRREILDQIMDEYYEVGSNDFCQLIDHFCLKDDKELKEAILSIYEKIELKYDKTTFLENYSEEYFSLIKKQSYVEDFVNYLLTKQEEIKSLLEELSLYVDGDFIGKLEDNFSKLLQAKTYDEFALGCDYQSISVPRGSSDEVKRRKEKIFKIASEIKELCIYNSAEEIIDEIHSTEKDVSCLLGILQEFDKRLDLFKKKNAFYGFSDISRLAIKVVMENSDVLVELQNQFQEIMVDEYQDTSDTQEMFISLIARDNVYMVGDIKQSIYRFRNANPTIFKEKYDLYQDHPKGEVIDLVKNFRSRGEVLDAINLLFDCFMDKDYGGADYQKSHRMVFGNTSYIEEGKTEQNYDMDVITYDKKDLKGISSSEEEAFIIGKDIQDKVSHSYIIFDKDTKVLRPVEYRDFVILLDKSKDFDLYKKVFQYLQIPLSILKDESLIEQDDLLVIRNLLRFIICIKEKRYDLEFRYTFTSICRSFLWRKTDDEIYQYFCNNSFLESDLYLKCLSLVPLLDSMNLSSFFYRLLEEFQYDQKLWEIGDVKKGRIREEYLYQFCQNYEQLGFSIYDFVDYLNDIYEDDYDLRFQANVSGMNSCQIMTIHKSKGLEFPICYFAGFSSRFNLNELKERILFDSTYGIVIPKVDGSYKDTILKTLIKKKTRKEEISERIRLLYVAFTRAKEKIIVVMPEVEEVEEVSIVPTYVKEEYLSFLDIMKSIYSVLLPYVKKSDVVGTKDYLKQIQQNQTLEKVEDGFNVEEINLPITYLENHHYSKEKMALATKEEVEMMKFGTKMHEILEEIDFSNYQLDDYDISDYMKKKLYSFLNSDFVKKIISYPMYKEYEFVLEDNQSLSHGIIDLLIDGEEVLIVDYKLKNIDDKDYDKQLNGYRDYIKTKTNKVVRCFLYSLMEEKYREVLE